MQKSSLCDYSDKYVLVKVIMIIIDAGANEAGKQADERIKKMISKSGAPFMDCISKINNTQVRNAKDLDVVIPIHNLI